MKRIGQNGVHQHSATPSRNVIYGNAGEASVIIKSSSCGSFLKQDSASRQPYADTKVIVVEDGSADRGEGIQAIPVALETSAALE